MKQTIYYLHSKWSLFSALWPYRLQFFENMLMRNFLKLWQYHLELPRKDYVIFFPYIVNVSGVLINIKNKRPYLQWRRQTIKDPINIVVYGASPEEFITILKRTNPKWEQFLGSSYFLYGSSRQGWQASIAIKLDIDKQSRERHHIRLFELKTSRGEKVTLGAAHRDWPNHPETAPPLPWNETRDLVCSAITDSNLGIICGLSEEVTTPNFRDAEGDGKILIIKMK